MQEKAVCLNRTGAKVSSMDGAVIKQFWDQERRDESKRDAKGVQGWEQERSKGEFRKGEKRESEIVKKAK